jgi:hypothetical protein
VTYVLLKEDNLPLLAWKNAVISDIRAGRDGLTRDVTGNWTEQHVQVNAPS